MREPHVWTFFYGSYINFDVLAEVDLRPSRWEVARLSGYDLSIAPRANLVRADGHIVYGISAVATHAELDRLYAHARDVLGETYLPEAVSTETVEGTLRPCLCFICHAMEPRPPERAYVERILRPAREHGFPAWYLERIERFLPPASA